MTDDHPAAESAMPGRQFWIDRWERNEIGFHQADVNPMLTRYAPQLFGPDDRILVPLCGKSLDMIFLAAHAREVIGIELSNRAVEAFFSENQLPVEVRSPAASQGRTAPGVGHFSAANIHILCADYFDVTPAATGLVDGVYDRASLVALSEPVRRRYAKHTGAFVKPGGRILLLTFEFDAKGRTGPPFHVSPAEVEELYSESFSVKLLETERRMDPRFGATREHCFLLTRADA